MLRSIKLPLLPGNNFDTNIGKSKFHRRQHFEYHNGIPMLTEKFIPSRYSKPPSYPSLYPRGETPELPAWIAYDKQVLCFHAYFKETAQEREGCPLNVRKVKIFFYMEDGTVQVIEPKTDNSGIPQGTLISRQRIRFPAPADSNFYDILDFNIGKEVELYGRVFKIVNCDKFTRVFLNRLGIHVRDPMNYPADPHEEILKKQSETMFPKRPKKAVDTLGQFLEFDRKILKFSGYWDDRNSEQGMLHDLEIYYFLADDTIQIKENIPPNSGRDTGFMFLRRSKIPKQFDELPSPGFFDNSTVLNVLSTGFLKARTMLDPLNCGKHLVEFYKENDLAIGAVMNVYGRKVVITGCDPFTKAYYAKKYGIEEFAELPRPGTEDEHIEPPQRKLPPYNGFGSFEDSAGNCLKMIPAAPQKDFVKFLHKDRQGLDSHILKFRAKLISRIEGDAQRDFTISYYLSDDTISIYENQIHNIGFPGGIFLSRVKVPKPGQEVFSSEPPVYYTQEDFYIGNALNIFEFQFLLLDADEYALRYMEINAHEFPKSNIILVINKIREALRPIYKQFVSDYLTSGISENGIVCFTDLSKVLKKVLGDKITDHELVTLARYYNASCIRDPFPREKLRGIVHTELKRFLFNALERMEENFKHNDLHHTGFVSRQTAYTVCRGAQLPIDKELLESVLDKINKNECGEIDYRDLVDFLDVRKNPVTPVEPLNAKHEFSMMSQGIDNRIGPVDFERLLKDLDLEKEIVQQSE